MPGGFAE
jgi:hypothetical protein